MNQKHKDLKEILEKEVKPALGCTGPTAISFVVAAAREITGGVPKYVRVISDRDMLAKNDDVGIPGTKLVGLDIAAALGAVCGDASAGLENLHAVTPEDEAFAREFAKTSVDIKADWDYDAVGLYVDAVVETDKGVGRAIIAKTHVNIVYKERDGKVIYQSEDFNRQSAVNEANSPIRKYIVKDFYDFAKNVPLDEIAFLQQALDMNLKLAEAGFDENLGAGFGHAYKKLTSDPTISYAKALTAAAADARMSGRDLPAMSCATSGNVGITGSLPLVAVARVRGKSDEELLRALALSYLLTIYGKNYIGRLSAMCACAVAASVGVAGATAMLIGGDDRHVDQAIKNTLASVFGIVCDGARVTCAFKLANAIGIAIEAALFALENVGVPSRQGIVGETADDTIALLGRVAREGMIDTDKTLCRAMYERTHGPAA